MRGFGKPGKIYFCQLQVTVEVFKIEYGIPGCSTSCRLFSSLAISIEAPTSRSSSLVVGTGFWNRVQSRINSFAFSMTGWIAVGKTCIERERRPSGVLSSPREAVETDAVRGFTR